jgi:protein-S-isoprenylcysteine O-methyltransferase Ste14
LALVRTATFVLALGVAVALIGLLLATVRHRPLRFWPTPGPGTWQYRTFWPLFRGLNVLCVASAVLHRTPTLGVPTSLRVVAGLVLAAAFGVFLYAFFRLGRDNSYGADDGLVTAGIYQWSRNPQNAMLIVFYGALALVADSLPTAIFCVAMMLAYHLMVLAEEPWLVEHYGPAYTAYTRTVPRYFNWARLLGRARSA